MFAALVLVFVIAGCGSGDDNANSSNNTNDNANTGANEENNDDGNASSDEEYVIKFAHVVSASTAKGKAAEKFGELIEERTNGQITVEIYPDSQLGSDREIQEQMQSGTVQMNAP